MPPTHKRPAGGERIPEAPAPAVGTAAESMTGAQELARRYMGRCVELWASIAFAPTNQTKIWTRLQASRMLALTAGAFPEAVPGAPAPSEGHDLDA